MTTLTAERYGERKLDLARAIEAADGEVHATSFKVQTGAAKAADLVKAKQHHTDLQEQLADLEAAWIGAGIAAAQDRAERARSDYATFLSQADAALAERAAALDAITAGARAAVEGFKAYDAATAKMRLGTVRLLDGQPAHLRNSILAQFEPDLRLPPLAIAAILGEEGSGAFPRTEYSFGQSGSFAEMERARAAIFRQRFELLAPAGVAAE